MTTPIPSWALEIARPIVTSGIGVATAIERIALALVEADAAGEKRGRAMGLEEAAKVAAGWDHGQHIAAEISALIPSPPAVKDPTP